MAESSACSWNHDPITDDGVCLLEGFIYSDALRASESNYHWTRVLSGIRTAQSIDAAASLARPSGTGVT